MRSNASAICWAAFLTIGIALASADDCRCAPDDSIPCPSQEGDPLIVRRFDPRYLWIEAGSWYGSYDILVSFIFPTNAPANWFPEGCKGRDTLCFELVEYDPLTVSCKPPCGTPYILEPGYGWHQYVSLHYAPCEAIGQWIRVIGTVAYSDTSGNCRPECGDCNNPNTDTHGRIYFSSDTLWVRVEETEDHILIDFDQDDMTLIEQGTPVAYLNFEFWNGNVCSPLRAYVYTATTKGIVGNAISQTDTIMLGEGYFRRHRVAMCASFANTCDYDTLSIEIHSLEEPVISAFASHVVHVIEPKAVPILSRHIAAVLTVLLLLAVAAFMRQRIRSAA